MALTLPDLLAKAKSFSKFENEHFEPSLYGVNDGKAVGTYLEQKFAHGLAVKYGFVPGNSASGIDIPALNVDLKTTSVRQPQSSCPFRSARQKVYGLGYHLLVFVYDKHDDHDQRVSKLNILSTIFVEDSRTADYQTTRGLIGILERQGNQDDVAAFLIERNLPLDEIAAEQLAMEIVENPPQQGLLTISNALQWRLQYSRVISLAGTVDGVLRIL